MIPKQRTMQIVSAGFGRGINHTTRGIAKFCGKGARLHRKLLNGFRRKIYDRARNANSGIIHAVSQHRGASRTASVHVQIKPWHWLL
jgi:hypothetical protein